MVTAEKAAFITIDASKKEIDDRVRELRKHLEKADYKEPFPVDSAHELYKLIFDPARPYLDGVEHIMIIPDGSLQSLPLSVLVTDPTEQVNGFTDYSAVSWLAKKYALSTLPALSSLRALRGSAKRMAAAQPFTGFGNPLLVGDSTSSRGITFARSSAGGAIADPSEVRSFPPLPETENELRTLARILHAPDSRVFVREAATESNVKQEDLSQYRILAFATHGLVAGEITGSAEPSLLLTPPDNGTEFDDGVLTASEIARLKLNVDWVILSACNTAEPDGTPGAERLSGLAKAFIYAGARALLVSHWQVHSPSAVLLTTQMLNESTNGVWRAEALRRSMLALMRRRVGSVDYTHPAIWAPFVVVGEGAE